MEPKHSCSALHQEQPRRRGHGRGPQGSRVLGPHITVPNGTSQHPRQILNTYTTDIKVPQKLCVPNLGKLPEGRPFFPLGLSLTSHQPWLCFSPRERPRARKAILKGNWVVFNVCLVLTTHLSWDSTNRNVPYHNIISSDDIIQVRKSKGNKVHPRWSWTNTDHISWYLLFCLSRHFPCICCESSFKSSSMGLLLLRTKIFRQKERLCWLQKSVNFYKTVKFLVHMSKEKEKNSNKKLNDILHWKDMGSLITVTEL